jgi:OH-DDVA meta-cleavage compound hydrolase
MIIDCHAHFTAPDSLWVYKANLLANRGGQGRSRWHCTDDAIHTALKKPVHGGKSHLEQLAEVGTDLQILSPRPYQLMHSEQPARLVRWFIEECNNLTHRTCQLYPEKFVGVCALPQSPGMEIKFVLDEVDRCITEQGMCGILLNPDPYEGEGGPAPGLGSDYWYPLYQRAVDLDVPVFIHAASCRSERESYTVHFLTEETIGIISVLESKVFQDFPTLKMLFPHGGGAIPYQIGRFMASRLKRNAKTSFEESLRKLYFDTALYTKEAIELLLKVASPERCLFGTERPGAGTAQKPDGSWLDDTKGLIGKHLLAQRRRQEGDLRRQCAQGVQSEDAGAGEVGAIAPLPLAGEGGSAQSALPGEGIPEAVITLTLPALRAGVLSNRQHR